MYIVLSFHSNGTTRDVCHWSIVITTNHFEVITSRPLLSPVFAANQLQFSSINLASSKSQHQGNPSRSYTFLNIAKCFKASNYADKTLQYLNFGSIFKNSPCVIQVVLSMAEGIKPSLFHTLSQRESVIGVYIYGITNFFFNSLCHFAWSIYFMFMQIFRWWFWQWTNPLIQCLLLSLSFGWM